MHKQRMKRLMTFFALVIFALSVAVLSASANTMDVDKAGDWYTTGIPSTLTTTVKNGDDLYAVTYNEVNVYLKGLDTPDFINRFNDMDASRFIYNHEIQGVADVTQVFPTSTELNALSIYEPMYLNENMSSREMYEYTFGVYQPHYWVDLAPIVPYSTINVRYTYSVIGYVPASDGTPESLTSYIVHYDHEVSVTGDWVYLQNIRRDDISDLYKKYAHFETTDGERYLWIQSAHITFPDRVWTTSVFYEPNPNDVRYTYSTFLLNQRTREARFFSDGSLVVDYEDVDVTTWLKNSVSGFLSFEIVPGLSFAGILGIVLGIPLLIWFLRMFAGG